MIDFFHRFRDGGAHIGLEQIVVGRRRAIRHRHHGHDLDTIEIERGQCAGIDRPLLCEDHLGLRRLKNVPQLSVIAGHDRVRDRYRRHRYPRFHRAEHHRGMRDRIPRQHHQRRVGTKAARQHCLCNRVRARVHLAIGDEPPVARAASGKRCALGDKLAVWVRGGPRFEQMHGRAMHLAEGMAGVQIDRSVGFRTTSMSGAFIGNGLKGGRLVDFTCIFIALAP